MTTRPTQHYYLAFHQIPGIGAIRLKKLLTQFGSVQHVFQAPIRALHHANLKPAQINAIKQFKWSAIEPSLRWAEKTNHHIITWESHFYPTHLKMITQPPPLLFLIGNPTRLLDQQLAIVGSRRPTAIGRENSRHFAYALAEHGLTITSGLATGVDAEAHEGALRYSGHTIAILGSGIDRIYPANHQQLAEEISVNGAIISEFPLGTPPLSNHFPQRNRIITGLTLGTLVIEAALKSGSLISARYAAEQGREVFAIPGSIHNPLAKGCHQLIQDGAKLVQTTADILEELPTLAHANPIPTALTKPPVTPSLTSDEKRLLSAVDDSATAFNTILTRSHLTFEQTTSLLLELRVRGLIAPTVGGYCRIHSN